MQIGLNPYGKLYIKFAMNFALPLGKGSNDIILFTKQGMLDLANSMIGKQIRFGTDGPIIGKVTDYENPVIGHYIFQIVVEDSHKEFMLKIINQNKTLNSHETLGLIIEGNKPT